MSQTQPPPEPTPPNGWHGGPGAPGQGASGAAELAGSAAAGAARGAAVGGLAGAAAGAVKGAATGMLRTNRGRTVLAVVLVLALSVPMMSVVLLGGVVGALGGAAAESAAQAESREVVAETTELDDATLSHLVDASSATNVPWQVLASLRLPATPSGLTLNPDRPVTGEVPEDLGECPSTGSPAEEGLTANALLVLRCGGIIAPQITAWGGVGDRAANPESDHPNGRAVDAMTTFTGDYHDSVATTAGWALANWYTENAAELGISYVIYYGKIWLEAEADDGWQRYAHPSGATDDTNMHYDHVHVSVYADGESGSGGTHSGVPGGGGGGWGTYRLTEESGLTQEEAEDDSTAQAHVLSTLNRLLAEHAPGDSGGLILGNGSLTLDDGERVILTAEDGAATGSSVSTAYNSDADALASTTREAYIAALAQLPIDGMDEASAAVYFDRARTWYLGQEYENATCVPVPPAPPQEEDGDGGEEGGEDGEDPADDSDEDEDEPADDASPGGGTVPDHTIVTRGDGVKFPMNASQLAYAGQVIDVGRAAGVDEDGILVALMVVFQESGFRMYANDTIPESLEVPHDAVGSDNSSVGLFQQLAARGSGWADESLPYPEQVAQLMDVDYSARAFFGGPEGPNHGSPRGLLDISRAGLNLGEQAQAVQVSAFPDHYEKWEPAARELIRIVGGSGCAPGGEVSAEGWARPVDPAFPITSVFGCRVPPVAGAGAFHFGIDFAGPEGSPIYAAADGTVVYAGPETLYHSGHVVIIDHGGGFYTEYNHMYAHGLHVVVGDVVRGGQHIADIGNEGFSSGAHLHFSMIKDPARGFLNPGNAGFINPIPTFIANGVDIWAGQAPYAASSPGPVCA